MTTAPSMAPGQPGIEQPCPLVVGVVEDNESDRALVGALLRRTRLDVRLLTAERLHDTASWTETPACILLDLRLPDSDGLGGLDGLVQAMPTVPIVILTGNDDQSTASAALARGAQDYLVKGRFDAFWLERTIRHAIDRKRAQLELDARRALNDAVLDSIDAHTAVLDHEGVIVSVNGPWRRFAAANGAHPDQVSVGVNYLDVCRQAAHEGAKDGGQAAELVHALEDVLAGRRSGYAADYACHSPTKERWFSLRASSLGPAGAVLVHVPITDHVLLTRELERRALHDPLTGLGNRALLLDRLTLLLGQRRRDGLAVAFIDLDGFKAVNDHYGHPVGDRLLKRVALSLQTAVRTGDVVARLGGDEFVVVGETEDAHAALAFGHRLSTAFDQPAPGTEHAVRASVGVAYIAPDAVADVDTAIAAADAAMFSAKRGARGVVLVDYSLASASSAPRARHQHADDDVAHDCCR